jgi:hypothetical protein
MLAGLNRLQALGLVEHKESEVPDPSLASDADVELRSIIRGLATQGATAQPDEPDEKAVALQQALQAEADEELRIVAERLKRMREKLALQKMAAEEEARRQAEEQARRQAEEQKMAAQARPGDEELGEELHAHQDKQKPVAAEAEEEEEEGEEKGRRRRRQLRRRQSVSGEFIFDPRKE